ncbi:ATP-binding protein [Mycoplasma mycoides subsp. capri]|uniref:ATP-binding protein n=1 Tax=Mycoplasma mycoides TaxID=2102 RepID=UPI002240368C|nr:ATP-binding protein [Mycoplasma mycoides]UZK64200.1 ATP-binding protein [Mycoplasma mycoides subsp. capri]
MEIKRDFYLNMLIEKMNNKKVKIITGIRRSGKSYILFKLFYNYLLSKQTPKDQIITITLDDIDFLEYRQPLKLNEYIKSKIMDENKQYYVLIDEIQYCEIIKNPYFQNSSYEVSFVDVLLSLVKKDNVDVYVTGSNSKMLSTDVFTQFRGRGDEIYVSPLSFFEIQDLFEDKKQALNHYMLYGGLPEVYNLQLDKKKTEYLKDLFEKIYIKDILDRHNIYKDKLILETLLNFISSSIGSLTNPNKLAKRFLSSMEIKISSNTISNYLDYFEESFIISKAQRYDVKGGKYFTTPLKYYFTDIGLRNAWLNFKQNEESHIMENIIYNDLIRRGYSVDVGVVEIRQKEGEVLKRAQLEIDFIINISHQRYYIQSALNVDTLEKRQQETRSLINVNDSFKKIVIVKENIIPKHDENGILYVGLEKFLLDDSFLDSLI